MPLFIKLEKERGIFNAILKVPGSRKPVCDLEGVLAFKILVEDKESQLWQDLMGRYSNVESRRYVVEGRWSEFSQALFVKPLMGIFNHLRIEAEMEKLVLPFHTKTECEWMPRNGIPQARHSRERVVVVFIDLEHILAVDDRILFVEGYTILSRECLQEEKLLIARSKLTFKDCLPSAEEIRRHTIMKNNMRKEEP